MGNRLLGLLLTSVILGGCASQYAGPHSANMSVTNHVGGVYSMSHATARVIENIAWSMPAKAANKHYNTIQFLINNQPVGSVAEWWHEEDNMHGRVKLLVDSTGNQTCRLYSSTVYWAHKQRTLTEWACTRNQGKTWNFYPKNS